MAESRVFFLRHAQARQAVADFAMKAPDGWQVKFSEPAKTREQEERYHAMIGDIARQWLFCSRHWDQESMKRITVDQFRRETAKDPELAPLWAEMGTLEMCPSIDGTGIVALGWQTRRFPKKLASAFIEYLFALGAEVGVKWSNECPAI